MSRRRRPQSARKASTESTKRRNKPCKDSKALLLSLGSNPIQDITEQHDNAFVDQNIPPATGGKFSQNVLDYMLRRIASEGGIALDIEDSFGSMMEATVEAKLARGKLEEGIVLCKKLLLELEHTVAFTEGQPSHVTRFQRIALKCIRATNSLCMRDETATSDVSLNTDHLIYSISILNRICYVSVSDMNSMGVTHDDGAVTLSDVYNLYLALWNNIAVCFRRKGNAGVSLRCASRSCELCLFMRDNNLKPKPVNRSCAHLARCIALSSLRNHSSALSAALEACAVMQNLWLELSSRVESNQCGNQGCDVATASGEVAETLAPDCVETFAVSVYNVGVEVEHLLVEREDIPVQLQWMYVGKDKVNIEDFSNLYQLAANMVKTFKDSVAQKVRQGSSVSRNKRTPSSDTRVEWIPKQKHNSFQDREPSQNWASTSTRCGSILGNVEQKTSVVRARKPKHRKSKRPESARVRIATCLDNVVSSSRTPPLSARARLTTKSNTTLSSSKVSVRLEILGALVFRSLEAAGIDMEQLAIQDTVSLQSLMQLFVSGSHLALLEPFGDEQILLSYQEFKSGIRRLCDVSSSDANGIIRHLDKQMDGSIHVSKFINWVSQVKPNKSKKPRTKLPHSAKRNRHLQHESQKVENKESELVKFVQLLQNCFSVKNRTETIRLLSSVDGNGDGWLTKMEFVVGIKILGINSISKSMIRSFFDSFVENDPHHQLSYKQLERVVLRAPQDLASLFQHSLNTDTTTKRMSNVSGQTSVSNVPEQTESPRSSITSNNPPTFWAYLGNVPEHETQEELQERFDELLAFNVGDHVPEVMHVGNKIEGIDEQYQDSPWQHVCIPKTLPGWRVFDHKACIESRFESGQLHCELKDNLKAWPKLPLKPT